VAVDEHLAGLDLTLRDRVRDVGVMLHERREGHARLLDGPCHARGTLARAPELRPRWRAAAPLRRRPVLRPGHGPHLFTEEHQAFRKAFKQFVEREIKPHQERWREQGQVDREVWRKAGAQGFLCPWLDEKYGGSGGDFLYSMIVMEELAHAYESGFAMPSTPTSSSRTSIRSAARRRSRRGCRAARRASGDRDRDDRAGHGLGPRRARDHRGQGRRRLRDQRRQDVHLERPAVRLVVVAAKTDPDPANAHKGISLFVVEATARASPRASGSTRWHGLAGHLRAVLRGLPCAGGQPARRRGRRVMMLMQKLQQERLCVAIGAVTAAEQVLADTIAYTKERTAFAGRSASSRTRSSSWSSASPRSRSVARTSTKVVAEHVAGKYLVKECSIAKFWTTDMAQEVIDTCLQFFGARRFMRSVQRATSFTGGSGWAFGSVRTASQVNDLR